MKFLKLLKNEYGRVFKSYKILAALILLIIGDAVILFFYAGNDDVEASEYKSLKETISEVGYDEGLSLLYDMQMEDSDSKAVNQLIDEYETAYGYSDYLTKIQEEAEANSSIAIFKNSSYAAKNIRKTAEDYKKLGDVEAKCIGSYGLSLVMTFMGTDIFLVIITVLLIAVVLLEDKKSGIMPMLRATRYGGKRYAFAKITCVTSISFIVACLMKLCNVAIGIYVYGDVPFGASIQSLYGFDKCGYKISIGEGILFSILISGLVYVFVGALMFLFASLADNYIIYYLLSGAFLAIEYALFYLGKHIGALEIFTKLNVVSMLMADSCLSYHNYNLFGKPIGMLGLNIAVIIFLTAIIIVLAVLRFNKSSVEYRTISIHTNGKKKKPVKGLWGNEAYKLFIGNKVIILFFAIILIQVFQYHDKEVGWNISEVTYRSYIEAVKGDATDEKYEIMADERQHFLELEEEYSKYDEQYYIGEISETEYDRLTEPINQELIKKNGFDKADEYVTYIKESNDADKGIVYDRGWNYLAGNGAYKNDILNGIILTMFIILALSGIMSQENRYDMNALINTACKKKRSQAYKMLIMVMVAVIGYIAVYLPEIIWVIREYGLEGGNYSVNSLGILKNVNLNCSITQYFILVYFIRLIMTLVIAFAAAFIGRLTKNHNITIIIAVIIFVVPLLLKLVGVNVIDSFSFNKLISGNMIFLSNE